MHREGGFQDLVVDFIYFASGGRQFQDQPWEFSNLALAASTRVKHEDTAIWLQDGCCQDQSYVGNQFFSIKMVAARTKHGNVTEMQL